MKKRIFTFLVVLTSLIFSVIGQDVQFSQFYAASVYENPAFVGSLHHPRVFFHQRLQWLNADASYTTSLLTADYYFDQYSSGLGLYVLRDVQGENTISSTEVALQYSYEMPINKDWIIRYGIQMAAVSRYLDYSDLTFSFQYDDYGFNGGPGENIDDQRKLFADVSAGVLLYGDNLWAGLSAKHMNQPNMSVFEEDRAKLPLNLSFIAGYKFNLHQDNTITFEGHAKEVSLSPTFHYKTQGKSDQADMGLYFVYDHLLAGVWYRGIPFKRFQSFRNDEAIIFMGGWKKKNSFEVRYSYDYTISKLGNALTGGAHEISLMIDFRPKNRNKPAKRLPCPSHHVIKDYNFL